MTSRLIVAITAAITVAAAALLLASRGPGDPPPIEHIVLVSIDTLRADMVGAYHPDAPATPSLDAFADESVLFENHISVAPTTLASHTSMFTGTAPHTHGVPRNDHVVSDENVMLQELLGEGAFTTAAFLGAMPLATHSNFPQGFDHLDENFTRHRIVDGVDQTQRPARLVNEAVFAWLDAEAPDDRLFLFIHFFDVHAPYDPPSQYREAERVNPQLRFSGTMRDVFRTRGLLRNGDVRALDRNDNLTRLYRAEVRSVDARIGDLMEGLRSRGMLETSVVVITSDHGETFGDRPQEETWSHGVTVYDDTVHTPLMIRFPNGWGAGRRVSTVVRNVDVFPTLLGLVGIDHRPVEGVDLMGQMMAGLFPPPHPPAFAEATKPHVHDRRGWQNAPMRKAVRTGDWKLHHNPRTGGEQLYDIASDPREEHLVDDDRRTSALRSQLYDWDQQADPYESPRLGSARVNAELKALGYLDEEEEAAAEEGAFDDFGDP